MAYSLCSIRPWVAGIAPGPKGAYSVALSGGYEDDIDEGEALYVPAFSIIWSTRLTIVQHLHWFRYAVVRITCDLKALSEIG